MSKVNDLFKWQDALENYLLITKNNGKAFANYSLNNGENIDYGVVVGRLRKEMEFLFGNTVAIFDFKSMGVYKAKEDFYVIGRNNCDCNSPTEITRQISELVIFK